MDSLGTLVNNSGGISTNQSVDYNVLKPNSPQGRAAQLQSRSAVNELISADSLENAEAYDSLSTLAISKETNEKNLIATERMQQYLNEAQSEMDAASNLNHSNRNIGMTVMSTLLGRDIERENLMRSANDKMALAKNQENIIAVNNEVTKAMANERNNINTAGAMFAQKAMANEGARNSLFPSDPNLAKAAMAGRSAGKNAVIDLSVEMKRTQNMMRINEGAQSSNPQAQRFLSASALAMKSGDPTMFKFAKDDYDSMNKELSKLTESDTTTRNVEMVRIDNDGMLPSQSKGLAIDQMFQNSPMSSNMGNIIDENERMAYEEYNKTFIANVINESAKANTSVADAMRKEIFNKANPDEQKQIKGMLQKMDKEEQNAYLSSMYAARYLTDGDSNLVQLIGNKSVNQLRNSNDVVARTNNKARQPIVNAFTNQYKDWYFREKVINNPAYAEFKANVKNANEFVAALPPEVQKEVASNFRSQQTINDWYSLKTYDMGGYQNRPSSILSMANWDQVPFDIYKQLNGINNFK